MVLQATTEQIDQARREREAHTVWCIMPILAHPEYTRAAIADCLSQSAPTRLLLINQGVDDAFRTELEQIAEEHSDRVLLWSHVPPLPSLAATWNRALDFVWDAGGAMALVVNNDVRLHRSTVEGLSGVMGHTHALFVSAVGVTPGQFDPSTPIDDHWLTPPDAEGWGHPLSPGGPDFSCFLISFPCHAQFRFDEQFTPAFCEDLDYHRRLMLAGEGKRIFSVNLPYLHYASMTLKTVSNRAQIEAAINAGSRAYYARKWGGPPNGETFVLPFHQTENRDVTTPALQRMVQEGHEELLPHVDPQWLGGQGNYVPESERPIEQNLLYGRMEGVDYPTEEEAARNDWRQPRGR